MPEDASPTREQELQAVAEAEGDPTRAMAEGVRTAPTEPTDPLDPRTRADGENYLGETTIFTRPKPDDTETTRGGS